MNTDEYKARGQEAVAELDRKLDYVRSNPRLSDQAKRSDIAAAWLHYREQVDALQAEDQRQRSARIKQLEQRLFHPAGRGSSTTERAARQASYRDALDRALKIESDAQARAALDLAFRTGDDDQAKALATIALDRSWMDTFDAYAEQHPGHHDDLQQLRDLKTIEDRTDLGLLMEREWLLLRAKPSELARVRDSQLPALAQERAISGAG